MNPRLKKEDVPADRVLEISFPFDKWVRLPGTDIEVLWFERVPGIRWLQYRSIQKGD